MLPSSPPVTAARSSHIPSLDGLRAISIFLVLLGHLQYTHGMPEFNLGIGDFAHLGVVVFFVISGFLITRLLLAEHAKKGRVSLRLFYARRALRLFPAAFVFIFCVYLMWQAGVIQMRASDFWHAITYTTNYLPGRSWELGHLWSLSVEEQFYLLWPCAFLLLGPRRAIWAAVAAILVGPAARSASWLFLRGNPYHDVELFPLVADSLATGCLLAKLSPWLESQTWYRILFRPVYSWALLGLVLFTNRYMAYTVVSVFGTSIIHFCLAILIHRSVVCYQDRLGQFLNWPPVVFVGFTELLAVSVAADLPQSSFGRLGGMRSRKISCLRSRQD